MTTSSAIDSEKVQAFVGKVLNDSSATFATTLAALGDRSTSCAEPEEAIMPILFGESAENGTGHHSERHCGAKRRG
jgi:hypothetical protein